MNPRKISTEQLCQVIEVECMNLLQAYGQQPSEHIRELVRRVREAGFPDNRWREAFEEPSFEQVKGLGFFPGPSPLKKPGRKYGARGQ